MAEKLLAFGGCQRITSLFWKLVSKGKNQAPNCLYQITDEGKFFFIELFQLMNKDRILELEHHPEGMAPGIEFQQQLTSHITL